MEEMGKNRPCHVRFETIAVETGVNDAGIMQYRDVDMAFVTPVGGNGNLVVEKPAEQFVKEKIASGDEFARFYKDAYEAWKSGDAEPIHGTPLKMWPAASAAQIKQLTGAGLKSVEDLAGAPAELLTKIGMGAVTMQARAKAWLLSAKDGKLAEKQVTLERDLAAKDAELKELRESVKALQALQKSKAA